MRRMFDLDSEPEAIALHLSADEMLAPLLLRNPGLRLPVAFDPSLAGVTLHHAFVTIGLGSGTPLVSGASNPVALSLLP